MTYSAHFCGWKGPALLCAFGTVKQKSLGLIFWLLIQQTVYNQVLKYNIKVVTFLKP